MNQQNKLAHVVRRFFSAKEVTRMIAKERIDALKEEDAVQKFLHINRYKFSAYVINKFLRWKNERILDIACGLGYGSYILHRETGLNTIGIDISKESISYAKKWYGKGVDFSVGDITALDLPSNRFSYVTCIETIEHLNLENAIKALQNLRRMIVPRGILIVSSPNRFVSNLLYRIYGNNVFHRYEFSPKELKRILTKLHFDIYLDAGQYLYNPLVSALVDKGFIFSSFFKPSEKVPSIFAGYFVLVAQKSQKPLLR